MLSVDLNIFGEVQSEVQEKVIEWMSGKAYKSATLRFAQPDFIKQNVLSKYPDISSRIEKGVDDEGNNFDFDYLASEISGVLDGLGSHAGGILTLGDMKDDDGNEIDINYISPLVYPADNTGSLPAALYEYHAIENNISKSDILGHQAPGTLANLRNNSGVDFRNIDLSDPKLYTALKDCTELEDDPIKKRQLEINSLVKTGNLGLPEISTAFIGGMLTGLNVENFSDVLGVNGLSHGTGIYVNGQKEPFEAGLITKKDMFFCREDVFNLLEGAGIDPTKAFFMVEKLRKGKKLDDEQTELLANCDLKQVVKDNIARIKYLFPNA